MCMKGAESLAFLFVNVPIGGGGGRITRVDIWESGSKGENYV